MGDGKQRTADAFTFPNFGERPRPRFRAHQWINTKTLKPIYSIQAAVGKSGWMHVSDKGKPMFYETAEARDAALKELTCGDPALNLRPAIPSAA